MDPIEILGGLLGGGGSSKSGGSLGGKILTDLLGGGRKSAPQPRTQEKPTSRRPSGRPANLDEHARQLEDLLGVAKDRYSGHSRSAPPTQQQAPPPVQRREPEPSSRSRSGGFSFDDRSPVGRKEVPDQNEEAVILIRAMINAAKSDGRITQDEQQEIVNRISSPSQEAIQFLREEFDRKMDVRDFAWSVPLGMEQKVYTLSLAAIKLDASAEAQYLRDLAHGLRLEPDFCNDLHSQYGVPAIF